MPEQIVSTTQTLWTGLNSGFSRFMVFVPSLIGGIIILFAGWFISKFVGGLVERLLIKMNLERVVEKAQVNSYLPASASGTKINLSAFIGGAVKWFMFLIFVQAAAITLGIVQLTAIINSIILFIPHLIVAVAIMVFGSWASRYFSERMSFVSPNMPAQIVRYGIMGFAVIAAVNQLGIATNLINILFTGLVASLSIAFGLAFGLGGRHAASDLTRSWLNGSRSPSTPISETSDKFDSEKPLSH